MPPVPPGRSTIWVQPSIPLRFVFESADAESLDPVLLTSLANSANSSGGMSITAEHATAAVASKPTAVA
jgi:hypothetical protein